MNCAACHADNDERRRYCGKCGEALIRWCAQCSFMNLSSDSFCGGCGGSLAERRPQRTHLTVAPAAGSPPNAQPRAHAQPDPPPVPAISEKGRMDGILSLSDLRELIPKAASEGAAPKQLSGKVSQAELDQLFGTQS